MRAAPALLALTLLGAEARPGDEQIAAQLSALDVAPLPPGGRGELSLVLLEPPDRALPLEIRVDEGPLALDEDRLDWSAVVDPLALQPRVRASFAAPREPGRYQVRARVAYSVCTEQWCRRKHGEVEWEIVVEADAG